jgi:hypothetical protein
MPNALNDLLQATLRSFYLTLRVLPARVRPQTGSAYLLAHHWELPASLQDTYPLRPFPETASLANIQGRFATRPVPKAQPEISQTRSVWSWRKRKFVLKGQWKFPNRIVARTLPPSRRDGLNFVERYQTLRVWLISTVAPRHGQTISGVNWQSNLVCHQPI